MWINRAAIQFYSRKDFIDFNNSQIIVISYNLNKCVEWVCLVARSALSFGAFLFSGFVFLPYFNFNFFGLAPPSGLQSRFIFSQQNNSSQSLIYEFLGF